MPTRGGSGDASVIRARRRLKRIIGMAYDKDVLYVLDAGADAVWMYEGKNPKDAKTTGVYFSEKPLKFFDEDVLIWEEPST